MIAHRLSTVKVCDRIVVMDRGTVSGVDTWDKLVETNHSFQKIAESA
jgi:ABC-type multidrug transport system fused ATPase/permease subunit